MKGLFQVCLLHARAHRCVQPRLLIDCRWLKTESPREFYRKREMQTKLDGNVGKSQRESPETSNTGGGQTLQGYLLA